MFGEPRDYDDYDGYAYVDPADTAREQADDLRARMRDYDRATFMLDEDAWAAGQ